MWIMHFIRQTLPASLSGRCIIELFLGTTDNADCTEAETGTFQ